MISLALYGVAALFSIGWIAFVMVRFSGVAAQSAPGGAGLTPDVLIPIAAAFGPVAAVFMIIAVIQGALAAARAERGVRSASQQARRAADESEVLTRTLIQMQEQARTRAFLDATDLVLKDLNAHLGVLLSRGRLVDREDGETLWALTAAGNPWAISQEIVDRLGGDAANRSAAAWHFAEDQEACAAIQRFLRRYDDFMGKAREADGREIVITLLEDGPMDRVRMILADVSQQLEEILTQGLHQSAAPVRQVAAIAAPSSAPPETVNSAPQRAEARRSGKAAQAAAAKSTAMDSGPSRRVNGRPDPATRERRDLGALKSVMAGHEGEDETNSMVLNTAQAGTGPHGSAANSDVPPSSQQADGAGPAAARSETSAGVASPDGAGPEDGAVPIPLPARNTARSRRGPGVQNVAPGEAPYPPLREDAIASIQSRVAKTLSRTVLSSRAGEAASAAPAAPAASGVPAANASTATKGEG